MQTLRDPGRRRPLGRGRHPQHRPPQHVRPTAGPGPRRAPGLLRPTPTSPGLLRLHRLRRPVHPARKRHHHRLDRPLQQLPPARRFTPHPPQQPTPTTATTKPQRLAQQSPLAQFGILCRRYLAVIAADRQYTLFLIALPLLLSLFTYAVPGHAGLSLAEAITQTNQTTHPVAGAPDHRRRTDGLRRLNPRDRQRTGHLPTRTRHRPVRRRLPRLQTRRATGPLPACKDSSSDSSVSCSCRCPTIPCCCTPAARIAAVGGLGRSGGGRRRRHRGLDDPRPADLVDSSATPTGACRCWCWW